MAETRRTNELQSMQIEDLEAKLRHDLESRDGLLRQLQQWKDTNRNLEEHLKYYIVHKEKTQTALEWEMQMNMILKAEKNGYYQFMKKLKV